MKKNLKVLLIFLLFTGCSLKGNEENVSSYLPESSKIALASSQDLEISCEIELSTSLIICKNVTDKIFSLKTEYPIKNIWFSNENKIIIQDAKKLYMYDLSQKNVIKTLDIGGNIIINEDIISIRNDSDLYDLDVQTFDIIQHILFDEIYLPGLYSPDKQYRLYAQGSSIDITNNETEINKICNLTDPDSFDVSWIVGFLEKNKFVYQKSSEMSNKHQIGILSLDGTFNRCYKMKGSEVAIAKEKAIIFNSDFGNGERSNPYIFVSEAPDYQLRETSIHDNGKFALSLDGSVIANLVELPSDDGSLNSKTIIKIFDFKTGKIISENTYISQTKSDFLLTVSDDGKSVAVSSYEDANVIYIYNLSSVE